MENIINAKTARKLYKIDFEICNNHNEKIKNINEIKDGIEYHAIVRKNQLELIKQIILNYLKKKEYIPKNVELEEVARQMAVHYAACIENVFCEELVQNTIADSVLKFLIICEPIENYDCEI